MPVNHAIERLAIYFEQRNTEGEAKCIAKLYKIIPATMALFPVSLLGN